MPVPTAHKIRFGAFELDRSTAELYKHGTKFKLQGQPIAVLALPLERPGELVTREELRKHLWSEDTFVDFENSLNTHIKKLRQLFDDDAETPRYIETLPRRGYRFIAQVEPVPNGGTVRAGAEKSETHADSKTPITPSVEPEPSPTPQPKPHRWKLVATATIIPVLAGAALHWVYRPRTPVVTAVHQLTHSGRQKILGGGSGPFDGPHLQTDGTRVYFQEFGEGKWQLAQVSTKGGDISYLRTPLIGFPWIADNSIDGSELLLADEDTNSLDVPFWVLRLPDGPVRKIPGMYLWMWFLPGTNRIAYQRLAASQTRHSSENCLA